MSFAFQECSNLKISATDIPDLSPLPISLNKWTASCSANKVDLKWSTLSESNSSHFIIESSHDNNNWNEIAHINGAGNSDFPKEYPYQLTPSDNLYYLLGQIDFDGRKIYSEIIYIKCVNPLQNITLYPNPNSGSFHIKGTKSPMYITIYSSTRQEVWGIRSTTQREY